MNSIHPPVLRDPVCIAVEALLAELEAQGKGRLQKRIVGGRVWLLFGNIEVESLTLDIALVRLAMEMMDDLRYQTILMDILREPMRASL